MPKSTAHPDDLIERRESKRDFVAGQSPILSSTDPSVSIVFHTSEGRIVALPYYLLQSCTLSADDETILADFGELIAVVLGKNLYGIHWAIAERQISRIQPVGDISSIEVGPAAEDY